MSVLRRVTFLTISLLLLSLTSSFAAQLTLTWIDNSNNEAEFQVERSLTGTSLSFSQIAKPAVNAITYIDTTVNEGISYTYRLRACNSAGCSAYSNNASGTPAITIPAAPSGVSVTP